MIALAVRSYSRRIPSNDDVAPQRSSPQSVQSGDDRPLRGYLRDFDLSGFTDEDRDSSLIRDLERRSRGLDGAMDAHMRSAVMEDFEEDTRPKRQRSNWRMRSSDRGMKHRHSRCGRDRHTRFDDYDRELRDLRRRLDDRDVKRRHSRCGRDRRMRSDDNGIDRPSFRMRSADADMERRDPQMRSDDRDMERQDSRRRSDDGDMERRNVRMRSDDGESMQPDELDDDDEV